MVDPTYTFLVSVFVILYTPAVFGGTLSNTGRCVWDMDSVYIGNCAPVNNEHPQHSVSSVMAADVTLGDPALAIALDIVRRFEGCVLHPYRDPLGIWTIGFGSTFLSDGSAVCGDTPVMTWGFASSLLETKLADFLAYVRSSSTAPLNDNEAAALASFTYNLGKKALRDSTLLRLLNAGKRKEAADEFPKWCHAGDKVLSGLVKRRAAEKALFLSHPTRPVATGLKVI